MQTHICMYIAYVGTSDGAEFADRLVLVAHTLNIALLSGSAPWAVSQPGVWALSWMVQLLGVQLSPAEPTPTAGQCCEGLYSPGVFRISCHPLPSKAWFWGADRKAAWEEHCWQQSGLSATARWAVPRLCSQPFDSLSASVAFAVPLKDKDKLIS